MLLNFNKIRARREQLGFSQPEAAQRAGMRNRQQWNEIEIGRSQVTLATLERIAMALLIQPRELINDIALPKRLRADQSPILAELWREAGSAATRTESSPARPV